jgi:apolipoprotein N-acyltransferase
MSLSSATVRSTAVALVCAFGLHLAFPLTTWWWIAPFAFAGLFFSWMRLGPRGAAFAGYASGIVFFALGFAWFGETAGALLGPAAPILDLGPALAEAVAFAFAALIASLAARACDVRAVPFVAAAAFTLGEQIRSSGPLGVPLEQIGITMVDSPLRPLAAFAGSYGLTFVTALLGATLGWWLLERSDARRARIALATWVAVIACAALAYAAWPARAHALPARRVAAVQGGIAQTLKMSTAGVGMAIERYVALTKTLAGSHATLVLWPETVINAPYVSREPGGDALSRRFAQLARTVGAPLYVGTIVNAPEIGWSNAIVIYDPHDPAFTASRIGITAIYGKEQLVPFAEYLPGPLWMRRLPYADQIGKYVPIRNRVATIGGATPLICWESNFGDLAFARLKDDPSLFLVATDDAWFGTTEGPYEQAQATTLRAVETGRWILRAGATGISGIIAPDGAWTQRTALGGQAVVVGDVGAPAPGPYTRIGPTPVGIVMALVTALPFLRRRRRGA